MILRLLILAFSATRFELQLLHLVFADFFLIFFHRHNDLYQLAQHIHAMHLTL